MNSAGRSLEQHEKIKVELLKNCPDEYDKDVFNNIWNEVERMDKLIFVPRKMKKCHIKQMLQ